MNISQFETTMNEWGKLKIPFLFLVDFEMNKPLLIPLDELHKFKIIYNINGKTNETSQLLQKIDPKLLKHPVTQAEYDYKFEIVHRHLLLGDSYLTNLTIKTEVSSELSLRELYQVSKARYKLLLNNECLVFSPEIFVQIRGNQIFSYPMKGTINAAIPDAATVILNDTKELAEHVTIVDLIRNDLSQVASNVRVTNFRYLEKIQTNRHQLLQVSSEVCGELKEPFENMGTILVNLLPAGSVSGAPKDKTVKIIQEAEGEKRGYYTGVMGIFDGLQLDSGVMIRFIENIDGRYFYRSGGGITAQSTSKAEYEEAIEKIYVPVD
jgi:para-aminobenzoate synthetase component 1